MKDIDLKFKNKLYVEKDFHLKDQFAETIKKVFHAESSSFNGLEPQKTAEDINKWVSEATNNKIQKLIDQS